MDLDTFRAAHEPQWRRLGELTRRRRLSGADCDELVLLYQDVATHLSVLRSSLPDPVLITRLSDQLARTRARLSGAHAPTWSMVRDLVEWSLPAALYRLRWWSAGVSAVFVVVAVVAGVWVAVDPAALAAMGTPAERQQYVDEAFASYYDPGAGFAAMVWTNNAWIAAQCVGLGISGVFPVYVLLSNAVTVGAAGGLMAESGRLDMFLSLILPHGLLELTAVLIAGAAGLRLFWTLVDPGPRPRGRALGAEGRALVTTVIGLAAALGVSGLVEGFVTGSGLPWWVKLLIGALVWAGFWTYVLVWGRRAVRAGRTGDLSAVEVGDAPLVAG